jgi:hypothetical protein
MLKNASNKFLLGSLFREIAPTDQYIKFSLDNDVPGLINARRTFVELEDPTGYKWAMRYLGGSYEHWQRLMACSWFQDAYKGWLDELKAKLQMNSLEELKDIIAEEGAPAATRAACARYLAEAGWEPKATKRGRPGASEIAGELKRAVRESREVQDDMERIGLKVV